MEKIIKTTDQFKAGISEAMNELNKANSAYQQAQYNVALYASGYADAMGIDKKNYYLNNEVEFQLIEKEKQAAPAPKLKALVDEPSTDAQAPPKPAAPKKNIPVVPPGRKR